MRLRNRENCMLVSSLEEHITSGAQDSPSLTSGHVRVPSGVLPIVLLLPACPFASSSSCGVSIPLLPLEVPFSGPWTGFRSRRPSWATAVLFALILRTGGVEARTTKLMSIVTKRLLSSLAGSMEVRERCGSQGGGGVSLVF